jgi:hypothetical protein
MIGEGTGSSLSVGESLVDGESDTEAELGGDSELLGVDDAVGSSAVASSPSSEPHATAVTATSASPAMATGIRVMGQVCLVRSTSSRRRPTFAGSTPSGRGRHDVRTSPTELLIL